MISAAIIKTDSSIELGHFAVNASFLVRQVAGHIEAVTLRSKEEEHANEPAVMWCNEEGKIRHLPPNVIATELYRLLVGYYDVIVGDVVVCGATAEGDDADLPAWTFDEITKAVDIARAAMQ